MRLDPEPFKWVLASTLGNPAGTTYKQTRDEGITPHHTGMASIPRGQLCAGTSGQLLHSPLLEKRGGTKSAILGRLTKEILEMCMSHKIRLFLRHLPGLTNTESDALSSRSKDFQSIRGTPDRPIRLTSNVSGTSLLLPRQTRSSSEGSRCSTPGIGFQLDVCLSSLLA